MNWRCSDYTYFICVLPTNKLYYEFYQDHGLYEAKLQELEENSIPLPHQFGIKMKPAAAEALKDTHADIFPFEGQYDFIQRMQDWTQFLEDVINAVSRTKELPQTGALTLCPPQKY